MICIQNEMQTFPIVDEDQMNEQSERIWVCFVVDKHILAQIKSAFCDAFKFANIYGFTFI